jgi:hypothetical protein
MRTPGAEIEAARVEAEASGKPPPTLPRLHLVDSGQLERTRHVIGEAEWTVGTVSPRFVVTSPSRCRPEARHFYETICCAREEMENRINESHLDLFADRTSATTMSANQVRLRFCLLRRPSESRTCPTIGVDRSSGPL